jgi:hypothetical protein
MDLPIPLRVGQPVINCLDGGFVPQSEVMTQLMMDQR